MLAWIITCIGLMLLPGPDMALVSRYTLSAGKQAGWSTVFGISLSFAIYAFLVAFGLLALINRWPEFLEVARIAGGIYLIILGVIGIKNASSSDYVIDSNIHAKKAWKAGFISNFLNAKQYLFLLILFPSFLPSSPAWYDSILLLLILWVLSLAFWAIWIYLLDRVGKGGAKHHRKIEAATSVGLMIVGTLLLVGVL